MGLGDCVISVMSAKLVKELANTRIGEGIPKECRYKSGGEGEGIRAQKTNQPGWYSPERCRHVRRTLQRIKSR